MKNIPFAPNLISLVMSGQKNQTIRYWKSCSLSPGDQILLFKKQKAVVIYCYRTIFGNLSQDEAKKDGFDTVDDLKKTLKTFYPNLTSHSFVFVIGFRLLDH